MHIPKTYKITIALTVCVAILVISCTKFDIGVSTDNPDTEWQSGGIQTVFDAGSGAYGHPFPLLPGNLERVHEIGDLQFEQTFVSAPAPLNSGLGPIFNNVSCASCHIADGRGKVPGIGESVSSILFRVSLPGMDIHGGPLPVPGFGDQIQNRGILGVPKEADVTINFTEQTFHFDDNTTYSLRTPVYNVINAYLPFPTNAFLSPRVAPPVFGLGLLEAISDADILSHADENDLNGDGISGKPNYVWNEMTKSSTLGRFGWKANQPSILQQVAAAYNGDMGVTNFLFPFESSFNQSQYDHLDDDYEIADSLLYSVEFYIKTLAVPGRRNATDPTVLQGKQIFTNVGCAKCHIPDFHTKVDVTFPQISNQFIHPYTDLLLHDMGDGLADNRPDFGANGREWRTPPLWGIGLTQKVNGHTNFMHDGRARNLMEAVMWHGGEAEKAKNNVSALSSTERNALIKFLESL
ncbi:MAG: c-type cytochrome [Bacteroidetes bacterium]|nr:c-type cytochrome [Bacteroidota bacterium]